MTPKEICETLLATPHLTDDAIELLREYRKAKGSTGAPTDLESAVIQAARDCQRCADDLRAAFADVAREAARIASGIAEAGTRYSGGIFATSRHFSTAAIDRLQEKRNAFDTLLVAWASVADRVHATDEERAQREQGRREALKARWMKEPAAKVRAAAKGLAGGATTDKATLCRVLAHAGIEPHERLAACSRA